MKKRAISEIVTIVLLVFITIVTGSIMWFGVSPIVIESMKATDVCTNAKLNINTLSGYTCYDAESRQVRIMVSRGPQEYELVAVDIGLSGDGRKDSKKVRGGTSEVLLHYPFDEGSGSLATDSVGKNTAEIFGAAWVQGKYGSALFYDGIDDFTNSTISSSYGDEITIEAWVLANSSEWQKVLGKANSFYVEGNGSDFNASLYIDGGWR